MTKKKREQVRLKFGGLCAYTGKPLDEKWQVDHLKPRVYFRWQLEQGDPDHIDNLLPAMRRVNHYKRSQTLELFRAFMLKFHIRLAKMPKNSQRSNTIKQKAYLEDIALLFDITPEKPFSGLFYFEKFPMS